MFEKIISFFDMLKRMRMRYHYSLRFLFAERIIFLYNVYKS